MPDLAAARMTLLLVGSTSRTSVARPRATAPRRRRRVGSSPVSTSPVGCRPDGDVASRPAGASPVMISRRRRAARSAMARAAPSLRPVGERPSGGASRSSSRPWAPARRRFAGRDTRSPARRSPTSAPRGGLRATRRRRAAPSPRRRARRSTANRALRDQRAGARRATTLTALAHEVEGHLGDLPTPVTAGGAPRRIASSSGLARPVERALSAAREHRGAAGSSVVPGAVEADHALGERAGLVGAQHVHAAEVLDRVQVTDEHAVPRPSSRRRAPG